MQAKYHYMGGGGVPQWQGCLPWLNRQKTNWSFLSTPSQDIPGSYMGGEQLKTIYLVGFTEERVTGIKAATVLQRFLASSFSFFPP